MELGNFEGQTIMVDILDKNVYGTRTGDVYVEQQGRVIVVETDWATVHGEKRGYWERATE